MLTVDCLWSKTVEKDPSSLRYSTLTHYFVAFLGRTWPLSELPSLVRPLLRQLKIFSYLHTNVFRLSLKRLGLLIDWQEQNPSLLSRFIDTVKQSWSRRSSAAVGPPSRDDPTDARPSLDWLSATDCGQPEVDLSGSPNAPLHSTDFQRIHRQLVEKLEPPISESASEFSASR